MSVCGRRPNGSLNQCRRCPRAGFSLVEVILVVVVIAAISSIAIPRFSNFLTRSRLEAAARTIQADLTLARQRAISLGVAQTISFNTSRGTYRILDMPDPDVPGRLHLVDLAEEPYTVELLAAALGGDAAVVFDAYGVPDSGGSVSVRAGGWTLSVQVQTGSGAAVLGGLQVFEGEVVPIDPEDPIIPMDPLNPKDPVDEFVVPPEKT